MESLPNFSSLRAFFPKERDNMIRIGSKEVLLPTIERTQCQNLHIIETTLNARAPRMSWNAWDNKIL